MIKEQDNHLRRNNWWPAVLGVKRRCEEGRFSFFFPTAPGPLTGDLPIWSNMDVDRVDQWTTSLKARSPWGENSRPADKASHSVKKRAKAIHPLMETHRQSISIKVQMNCHFSPLQTCCSVRLMCPNIQFHPYLVEKKAILVLFWEIFHKWNINITKCTFIRELWINFEWDSISMAHPSRTPQSTLQTCNILMHQESDASRRDSASASAETSIFYRKESQVVATAVKRTSGISHLDMHLQIEPMSLKKKHDRKMSISLFQFHKQHFA